MVASPQIQRWVFLAMIALASGCATSGEKLARVSWEEASRVERPAAEPKSAPSKSLERIGSLSELLQRAKLENHGIQAAYERWEAAIEGIAGARTLPDPKLTYANFLQSVETRLGPQNQKFGLAQTIPLGKLGPRGDIAANQARVMEAHVRKAEQNLELRLSELWFDYYFLARSVQITEENLSLMEQLESVALSQYAAGKASQASVVRAQVELAKLEDRLRTLRDAKEPLIAMMSAELSSDTSHEYSAPASLPSPGSIPSSAELKGWLRRENPELNATLYELKKTEFASKLANRSTIPNLTLGVEYIDTGEAVSPSLLDSGKDAAVVMAAITLPIWLNKNGSQKREARANVSAKAEELDQLESRLLAELEQAHFKFRDAERRIDLFATTLLPKARQSLEVSERAFAANEIKFLDLIDSQRTLLEFELNFEQALVTRAKALAKLNRLVGGVLVSGETRMN